MPTTADALAPYLDAITEEFRTGVRPPTHADTVKREEAVLTRDGVSLRTLIYTPEGEGPWPTLLTRTPYAMEVIEDANGREHALRGVAYVVQFCRGTGGSGGEWVPNENERYDGIDTVNWLDDQRWAGDIGIHGLSYMALTTWLYADQLPSSVKGIYVAHYSVDRYLSAYGGGMWRPDVLTGWAMSNAGKEITADYLQSAAYRPQLTVDEDLWGVHLDWYRDWVSHPQYDDYWRSGVWKTLRDIPAKVQVPVYVQAGWFDHHLEGTLLSYQLLNDETRAKSRLIIGGWDHETTPTVPAHNPQHAYLNLTAVKFNWFEALFNNTDSEAAPITTYTVGEDAWHEWPHWPLDSGETRRFHLTATRNGPAEYSVTDQPASQPSTAQFEYNPESPVPSIGGESLLNSKHVRGSKLQPDPGYRNDVLSFVTDPVDTELAIVGAPLVSLFVSTTADDTAFTARLSEVLPDGRAFNVRTGIRALSARDAAEHDTPYRPGEIVQLNIELLPITWTIQPGSRLRLDISSSDFPQYVPHTNHAGTWSQIESTVTATQTIHFGPTAPSRFEIPTTVTT
jgi:putative CocE/NonD family hydrolase